MSNPKADMSDDDIDTEHKKDTDSDQISNPATQTSNNLSAIQKESNQNREKDRDRDREPRDRENNKESQSQSQNSRTIVKLCKRPPTYNPRTVTDNEGKIIAYLSEQKIRYSIGSSVYVNSSQLRLAGDTSYGSKSKSERLLERDNLDKSNRGNNRGLGRSTKPYMIATITDIRVTPSRQVIIHASAFFRAGDIPENAFHLLWHGRRTKFEKQAQDLPLFSSPKMQCRELFASVSDNTLTAQNSNISNNSSNTNSNSNSNSHDNNSSNNKLDSSNINRIKESFPASALAGLCNIKHLKSFSLNNVKKLKLDNDSFFYILGYNSESKRLITLNSGEVHIGACYEWSAEQRGLYQQAAIPDQQENPHKKGKSSVNDRDDRTPPHKRSKIMTSIYHNSLDSPAETTSARQNQITEVEELIWEPTISNDEYLKYLQHARSLASFAGMCSKGKGIDPNDTEAEQAIARDETVINALDTLFSNGMSVAKALEQLGKDPMPLPMSSKWPDDEVKLFIKGLKTVGKNFFRIKKEYLPHKQTSELTQFYYLWKKSPDGQANRQYRCRAPKRSTNNNNTPYNRRYVSIYPVHGRYSPTMVKSEDSGRNSNNSVFNTFHDNESSLSADEEVAKNFQKYGKSINPYSTGRSSADIMKSDLRRGSSTSTSGLKREQKDRIKLEEHIKEKDENNEVQTSSRDKIKTKKKKGKKDKSRYQEKNSGLSERGSEPERKHGKTNRDRESKSLKSHRDRSEKSHFSSLQNGNSRRNHSISSSDNEENPTRKRIQIPKSKRGNRDHSSELTSDEENEPIVPSKKAKGEKNMPRLLNGDELNAKNQSQTTSNNLDLVSAALSAGKHNTSPKVSKLDREKEKERSRERVNESREDRHRNLLYNNDRERTKPKIGSLTSAFTLTNAKQASEERKSSNPSPADIDKLLEEDLQRDTRSISRSPVEDNGGEKIDQNNHASGSETSSETINGQQQQELDQPSIDQNDNRNSLLDQLNTLPVVAPNVLAAVGQMPTKTLIKEEASCEMESNNELGSKEAENQIQSQLFNGVEVKMEVPDETNKEINNNLEEAGTLENPNGVPSEQLLINQKLGEPQTTILPVLPPGPTSTMSSHQAMLENGGIANPNAVGLIANGMNGLGVKDNSHLPAITSSQQAAQQTAEQQPKSTDIMDIGTKIPRNSIRSRSTWVSLYNIKDVPVIPTCQLIQQGGIDLECEEKFMPTPLEPTKSVERVLNLQSNQSKTFKHEYIIVYDRGTVGCSRTDIIFEPDSSCPFAIKRKKKQYEKYQKTQYENTIAFNQQLQGRHKEILEQLKSGTGTVISGTPSRPASEVSNPSLRSTPRVAMNNSYNLPNPNNNLQNATSLSNLNGSLTPNMALGRVPGVLHANTPVSLNSGLSPNARGLVGNKAIGGLVSGAPGSNNNLLAQIGALGNKDHLQIQNQLLQNQLLTQQHGIQHIALLHNQKQAQVQAQLQLQAQQILQVQQAGQLAQQQALQQQSMALAQQQLETAHKFLSVNKPGTTGTMPGALPGAGSTVGQVGANGAAGVPSVATAPPSVASIGQNQLKLPNMTSPVAAVAGSTGLASGLTNPGLGVVPGASSSLSTGNVSNLPAGAASAAGPSTPGLPTLPAGPVSAQIGVSDATMTNTAAASSPSANPAAVTQTSQPSVAPITAAPKNPAAALTEIAAAISQVAQNMSRLQENTPEFLNCRHQLNNLMRRQQEATLALTSNLGGLTGASSTAPFGQLKLPDNGDSTPLTTEQQLLKLQQKSFSGNWVCVGGNNF